eukprot:CAMPEP_0119407170 /NCGR_PEP_ID=MMETSP1335-20130426/1181_1 /TAXON_ID=259385 /ORGANISM="Chrysoculter rhomboideus, Strain RCC1486" /LENGTH=70 /DNA_ID=CAMNT_0007431263 /DNA_START=27 /DNA_END=239 /DNA_ORIENTATION=+
MAAEPAHPSVLVHGDGDSLCTNPIGSTVAPAVAENELQTSSRLATLNCHARRTRGDVSSKEGRQACGAVA